MSVLTLGSLLLGCTSAEPTPPERSPPPPPDTASTTSLPTTDTAATTSIPPRPTGIDPADDLAGLEGLACASMSQCAPADEPWLGETCCAYGDPLVPLSREFAFVEAVDIEARDDLVAVCTGFGGFVARVQPDGRLEPQHTPGIPRCQRAAIGPEEDGARLVYFAHHGDTVEPTPTLWIVRVEEEGPGDIVDELREVGVLFEGLAVFDDHLWIATHADGVRVYELDELGRPIWIRSVRPFDNAQKIAVRGDFAYVTDQRRIQVLDASDPSAPVALGGVVTSGAPRDVAVDATHVFVALGADGVEVFRRDGSALIRERRLDLDGSAQAVEVHGDYVAIANWDHLALLERDGLDRVGGIRLKQQFEQTWGVAMTDDFVFAAEWFATHTLAIRPGFVAPELASETELLTFTAGQPDSRTVWFTNRGPLNALLGEVQSDHPAFEASLTETRVRPGDRAAVIVSYDPGGGDPPDRPRLALWSNDPSDTESPLPLALFAADTELLDVGDRLTEDFAFLDPTGQGELANLEGKVTLLEYFALF